MNTPIALDGASLDLLLLDLWVLLVLLVVILRLGLAVGELVVVVVVANAEPRTCDLLHLDRADVVVDPGLQVRNHLLVVNFLLVS